MTAYDILKSQTAAGGYKLAEIQTRIKRMFLIGDITEEQFEELIQRSVQGASPDAERPETLQLIYSLADRIAALEARLNAMDNDEPEPEEPAYPEWVPWDGISSDYQPGAIVQHNGKLWRSDYSGQNVWEPGTVGTKGLWVEVE